MKSPGSQTRKKAIAKAERAVLDTVVAEYLEHAAYTLPVDVHEAVRQLVAARCVCEACDTNPADRLVSDKCDLGEDTAMIPGSAVCADCSMNCPTCIPLPQQEQHR